MLMKFDPNQASEWVRASVRASALPFDAYRDDDGYVVEFDLPGVNLEDIDVTVENNTLTVSAERTSDRPEGTTSLAAGRLRGSFRRSLYLDSQIDNSKVEARYDRGVLTLRLGISESAKSRRVEVVGASS